MISSHRIAPKLETERLVLRSHVRADFDLHFAFFQTERAKFVGGPRNRDQVWNDLMNVAGQWAVDGIGGWAITLKSTGQVIGQVAICQPPAFPELELGWLLYDGFEGHGFASEAAAAALQFFRSECSWQPLVSYIDPDNIRSQNLARKLGAQRDEQGQTPNNEPTWVFRYSQGQT